MLPAPPRASPAPPWPSQERPRRAPRPRAARRRPRSSPGAARTLRTRPDQSASHNMADLMAQSRVRRKKTVAGESAFCILLARNSLTRWPIFEPKYMASVCLCVGVTCLRVQPAVQVVGGQPPVDALVAARNDARPVRLEAEGRGREHGATRLEDLLGGAGGHVAQAGRAVCLGMRSSESELMDGRP